MIVLTIATFILELGVVFCFLFAIFLYFSLNDQNFSISKKKVFFLICLPSLIYLCVSAFDLFMRGGQLSPESQGIAKITNILFSIKSMPQILFWWIFAGIFPNQLDVLAFQRIFICPLYVLNFDQMMKVSNLINIPVIAGVSAVLLYCFLIVKGYSKEFLKNNRKELILIISMLISLAFLIGFARISLKGMIGTLIGEYAGKYPPE